MTNLTITEVNCTTGEEIVRPMTTDEIASHEAMLADSAQKEAERQAAAQAKADAKLAAQTKLQALGLTLEEIAALG
jgi:hypothetical protein